MKSKRIASMLLAGAAAILVLALVSGSVAARSGAGVRSFHGTVAKVAENGRALTVNLRRGSRAHFVVRVTTRYEHISGLSGLSRGTRVEVKAFQSGDRWIATRIEGNPGRSGGGGSDDPPGDDHGSGGHGSDDPPGDDHGSGHSSDD